VRFAADENLNNNILRGLRRRNPELDLVRVQDAGLLHAADQTILAWASHQGRILLTHDVQTMVGFAWERVMAGLPMPGLVVIRDGAHMGNAIEAILLLAEQGLEGELEGRVEYLP
jgi:predicted nuclease of predicted toxin-antitoxin system